VRYAIMSGVVWSDLTRYNSSFPSPRRNSKTAQIYKTMYKIWELYRFKKKRPHFTKTLNENKPQCTKTTQTLKWSLQNLDVCQTIWTTSNRFLWISRARSTNRWLFLWFILVQSEVVIFQRHWVRALVWIHREAWVQLNVWFGLQFLVVIEEQNLVLFQWASRVRTFVGLLLIAPFLDVVNSTQCFELLKHCNHLRTILPTIFLLRGRWLLFRFVFAWGREDGFNFIVFNRSLILDVEWLIIGIDHLGNGALLIHLLLQEWLNTRTELKINETITKS